MHRTKRPRRHQISVFSRPSVRFAAGFGACFLVGFGVLMTDPAQSMDARISRALVRISHQLIQVCGGRTETEGAVLRDPASGFAVEMKDGCNAVNLTILLWSAVVAFPAPWRLKVLGAALGSIFLQAMNLLRFISLFYLGRYSMTWFDFAHGYLWETLLVLDTLVVFGFWVNRVSGHKIVHHAR